MLSNSFPFSHKGFASQFAFASGRKTVQFAGQVPLTSVLKLGGFCIEMHCMTVFRMNSEAVS